jgi:hypothetical protein
LIITGENYYTVPDDAKNAGGMSPCASVWFMAARQKRPLVCERLKSLLESVNHCCLCVSPADVTPSRILETRDLGEPRVDLSPSGCLTGGIDHKVTAEMPTIHPDLRPVCDEHTSLLCNWHSYGGFSQVTNEFVDSKLIRTPSERTTLSNEELLDSISEGSTVEFVIEQRSVEKCHSS